MVEWNLVEQLGDRDALNEHKTDSLVGDFTRT